MLETNKKAHMNERLKIAVFVDYDNIEIGVKSTLQREFEVATVLDIHNKAQLVQYAIQKKVIKLPALA